MEICFILCYLGLRVRLRVRDEANKKRNRRCRFAKNNWLRNLVVVKRASNRKLDELRVEVGVKDSFKNTFVMSRLK